jgi:energy-coupling factor transporter ATP-binding protein EcfA2
MGIVTQEAILFNDTVYNNITFGMENVSKEQVINAAKVANAHNFIIEMENGYDTNIGDRGAKLSGGQRQRLAIARAVLKNPPILILDEATSALDTESERMVQDALTNLMKNRTSIVIAHRLSTIQNADEIVVLQKGEIIERGCHDELIKAKGLYFNRPSSELIFLRAKDHMKLHMNEEQKEKISTLQLKLWKKPSRKRKVRDKFANKRENGEFLTNIEQMKSDADYREYQKQYKHIWYEQNRAAWNEYNYKRKLAKLSIKELEALKNKHENSIKLAEAMGRYDRKEKLKKHIQTILEVIDNKRPTKQEVLETMWKHDDLRNILDSDLENG